MDTPIDSIFSISTFIITKDEFNAFHSMDRALYSRLVLVNGRDPTESMQVMSLWLWLERHSGQGRNFVNKLLIFPVEFVNMLAEESLMCLNCVKNDSIIMTEFSRGLNDVPLLHSSLGGPIKLFYFVENRVRIFADIEKILAETCLRAFDDIIFVNGGFSVIGAQPVGAVPFRAPPHGGNVVIGESSMHVLYNSNGTRDMFGNVIMQEGVGLGYEHHHGVAEVESDQRTIFLTFSKGYPTSELEVQEFFTRRYGDIVEAIHMQEVLQEEQSLYARLVVREAGIISIVLEGTTKGKFTINGEHVWARKYVKKNNQIN